MFFVILFENKMHFVTLPQTTCAHITARAERARIRYLQRTNRAPPHAIGLYPSRIHSTHSHTHGHTHGLAGIDSDSRQAGGSAQLSLRQCFGCARGLLGVYMCRAVPCLPACMCVCVCELLCVLPSRLHAWLARSRVSVCVCVRTRVCCDLPRARVVIAA